MTRTKISILNIVTFHWFCAELWIKSRSWGLLKNLIEVYDKIELSADIHIGLQGYGYGDDLTLL